MIQNTRDFHVHATAYRVGNPRYDHTAAALITRAVELGIRTIGIVEHLNDSPKHPPECVRALSNEYHNLVPSIETYLGAEADIIDDAGSVTCTPGLKNELGLDYLLAAVHTRAGDFFSVEAYVNEELRRHIGAMRRNAHIDVCAHPWRLGANLERSGVVDTWSFEYVPEACQRELIESAAKYGVAIEVNLGSRIESDDPGYIAFLRRLKDSNVRISVGSDAHHMRDMHRGVYLNNMLAQLGFDEECLWMPASRNRSNS